MPVNGKEFVDQYFPYGLPAGWRVDQIDVETRTANVLVFDGRVDAEDIVIGERVYSIPEELLGVFYVKDVAVPTLPLITYCFAKGFHPHVSDTATSRFGDREIYRYACVGELQGSSIRKLEKLPSIYRHITYGHGLGEYSNALMRVLIGETDPDELDRIKKLPERDRFEARRGYIRRARGTEGEVFGVR